MPNQPTINAIFGNKTLRVYQAYSSEIALPAINSGRFLPPFKKDRMTWIKPSFNWMMYRSGRASKAGQEFVLGIDITREGFEWALANSAFSSFNPRVYASHDHWREELERRPVRIQWDPARDATLLPIPGVRTIQIGLSGEAVDRYVQDWIISIEDVTDAARASANRQCRRYWPDQLEQPYPLPTSLQFICWA